LRKGFLEVGLFMPSVDKNKENAVLFLCYAVLEGIYEIF
jgi:hypothetical protein